MQGDKVEVVDLPGIYSLSAASLDEEVAREYLLSGEADVIVNILDASNLDRNLYLTTQLLEMKVPLVLALNMMDMARARRIEIDTAALSKALGCPVIPITASKGEGIEDLKAAIKAAAETRAVSSVSPSYPEGIREAAAELMAGIKVAELGEKADPAWVAVKLLEGDSKFLAQVGEEVRRELSRQLSRIEESWGKRPTSSSPTAVMTLSGRWPMRR